MFLRLGRRRERQETIERLYGAIVAQARLPVFYADLAVPDTLEGRFDMIVLHVYLVYRRLAGEADAAREIGQGVFDRFIEDMDASLREMGTGDMAVPKRMRTLGEAFYGRAAAYDAALKAEDNRALAQALWRNVYGGRAGAEPLSLQLARYVRQAASSLVKQDAQTIARGEFQLPAPEV